jgi:hypothetical protein
MVDAKELILNYSFSFMFSVCTFVTKPNEYELMKYSFLNNGFSVNETEFLYFDNSKINTNIDAFEGINYFLKYAKGKYIIICHQDIEVIDNKEKLLSEIDKINALDKNWALLSNAGGYLGFNTCYYISYPDTGLKVRGKFPVKIETADENFILIKSECNISASKNLNGFHFYGPDLCLISSILGYSNYAIEYNVLHKSRGKHDESFWGSKTNFKTKYAKFLKNRWVQTSTTPVFISDNIFFKALKGNKVYFTICRLISKFKL